MQKGTFFILIGIAIIILVIGLGLFYRISTNISTPKYLRQSCEYDLSLETNFARPGDVRINSSDNPIRNITMIIPLPHWNGKPLVMNEELTPELFQQYSIERLKGNATPIERTPPFNYTFIENNGTQMVEIKGAPDSTLNLFRMEFKQKRDVEDKIPAQDLQKTVNTRTPLGNSTVFVPDNGCVPASSPSCTYTVPVYVSYDTDPTTTLTIFSRFKCANNWVEGTRDVGNSYLDLFILKIKGSAHGGYNASGSLEAGRGIYEVGGHI